MLLEDLAEPADPLGGLPVVNLVPELGLHQLYLVQHLLQLAGHQLQRPRPLHIPQLFNGAAAPHRTSHRDVAHFYKSKVMGIDTAQLCKKFNIFVLAYRYGFTFKYARFEARELPRQPGKFTVNTSSGRDINSRKNSPSTPTTAGTMTTAGTRGTPMALKT